MENYEIVKAYFEEGKKIEFRKKASSFLWKVLKEPNFNFV